MKANAARVRLCQSAAAETAAGPCTRSECRYAVAVGSRCALRFADEHVDGMTLAEIADVFGCTRENVRLIEAKALLKLARRSRVDRLDLERDAP